VCFHSEDAFTPQPGAAQHRARVGCARARNIAWTLHHSRTEIGNESAPIQLAQCRFPGLAISNAKIFIYFSKKIYGSNFIEQHSETVIVRVTKMLIEKKRIVSFIMIFGTLSFPIQ